MIYRARPLAQIMNETTSSKENDRLQVVSEQTQSSPHRFSSHRSFDRIEREGREKFPMFVAGSITIFDDLCTTLND